MPYLENKDRERLKKDNVSKTAGDMNFQINLSLFENLKNWHKEKVIKLGNNGNLKFPVMELAKIMNDYIDDNKLRYQRINDCVGACVCGVFEFIRRNPCNMPIMLLDQLGNVTYDFIASWYERNAVDYEDKKIEENGDVFPIKED